MLPTADVPETSPRRRLRRNLIVAAVAAVLAITGTVVAITASGGSRSGLIINGCYIGPFVQCVGADFTGADLRGANLRGANLTAAVLTGADLTGADLTGTNLYGAVLTTANLTTAILTGVYYNIIGTPSALPTGWVLVGGVLKPG